MNKVLPEKFSQIVLVHFFKFSKDPKKRSNQIYVVVSAGIILVVIGAFDKLKYYLLIMAWTIIYGHLATNVWESALKNKKLQVVFPGTLFIFLLLFYLIKYEPTSFFSWLDLQIIGILTKLSKPLRIILFSLNWTFSGDENQNLNLSNEDTLSKTSKKLSIDWGEVYTNNHLEVLV